MKPIASVDRTYELLVQTGIHPKRQFGQNFLIDSAIVERIVSSINVKNIDLLIEIGPGFGALTESLVKFGKPLSVIEIDHHLANLLPQTLGGPYNLKIVEMDVMKFDFNLVNQNPYGIVSNLPYYITSDILERVLLQENPPSQMVVMMQKEVAMKYLKPLLPPDHVLFLMLPYFYDVTLVTHVSKNSFFPRPSVDSTVLLFTPKGNTKDVILSSLGGFIQSCYQQRRKTLVRRLLDLGHKKENVIQWIQEMSLKETIRSDELSMEQWILLFQKLAIQG